MDLRRGWNERSVEQVLHIPCVRFVRDRYLLGNHTAKAKRIDITATWIVNPLRKSSSSCGIPCARDSEDFDATRALGGFTDLNVQGFGFKDSKAFEILKREAESTMVRTLSNRGDLDIRDHEILKVKRIWEFRKFGKSTTMKILRTREFEI